MIVYIASYPRSGNSWVSRLLSKQFRYLKTAVHGTPDSQRERFLQGEWDVEGHFRLVDFPSVESGERIARYVRTDGDRSELPLLMPGSQRWLEDIAFRRRLAAMPEWLFVKTHLPPYAEYFPGEKVVQPVRHPGASIWSYFHFLRDVQGVSTELEAVIQGEVGFRCWSDYQIAWDKAAEALGPAMLRVRYEDLFGAELDFCDRLSRFTGLPVLDTEVRPFAFHQRRRPLHARSGRIDEWVEGYSSSEFELLRARHAEQMGQYGYEMPD